MSASNLRIDRLTPAIGAELSGIDLAAPLDSATCDAVYQALIDHLVIFFRDQAITPEIQATLARSFGEPEPPHPVYPHLPGAESVMVLENDAKRPPDTGEWHADVTFKETPPFASILHAKVIPETGGDTLWASMYAAYDALPAGLKQELSEMSAVHDLGSFRNNFITADSKAEALNEGIAGFGSAVHPVVKHHPVTGRLFLYVNQGFTAHLVGVSKPESERLLGYLFDHLKRPEFHVRFRWQANALAMWDNRVTQHYAVPDYMPHYRLMHRVTVINDRRAEQAVKPALASAG